MRRTILPRADQVCRGGQPTEAPPYHTSEEGVDALPRSGMDLNCESRVPASANVHEEQVVKRYPLSVMSPLVPLPFPIDFATQQGVPLWHLTPQNDACMQVPEVGTWTVTPRGRDGGPEWRKVSLVQLYFYVLFGVYAYCWPFSPG